MKVIDLLNKIANGEKVPKKIYWGKYEFINGEFKNGTLYRIMSKFTTEKLNEEVEIIEDTPKEYINVSEEQVLFNNLSYEEQQFILKQMRMLQPCEIIDKINGGN